MAEGACDHEAGGDLGEAAVDGGHPVGVAGGELRQRPWPTGDPDRCGWGFDTDGRRQVPRERTFEGVTVHLGMTGVVDAPGGESEQDPVTGVEVRPLAAGVGSGGQD